MVSSTRMQKLIFIALAVMLLIIHSWTAFVTFHYPYIGLELQESDDGSWRILKFFNGSAAKHIGLQKGDEILTVDESPVNEHATVYKFHDIELAHRIEVNRDGQLYDFNFHESPAPLSSRILVGLAAELVFFAVALFLALKVKRTLALHYLITMFVLTGLVFMCAEASSHSDSIAKFLTNNAMSFIPFMFAQFIYHFLRERGYKLFVYWWLKGLFIILAVIAASRVIYFFNAPIYSFAVLDRMMTLGCFAAGCLFVLILLFVIYRRKRLEYSFSAKIIKIIFQAFMISFLPFLLLTVVPDLFGMSYIHYAYAMWFIFLFPMSIIYFTMKYKLFKHRRMIRSFFPGSMDQLISFNKVLAAHGQTLALTDIESVLLPQVCSSLGLLGLAIRIEDQDKTRLAACGRLNYTDVDKAIASNQALSPMYTVYAIHSKYDFTSHLVIKNKQSSKNVSANKQICIEVLLSWLAVTLENIYLSEKLSMKVEELFAESAAALDQSGDHYLWFRNTLYQMQEKERRRIAAELHDTVMQDIFFAKQRVDAIRRDVLQPSNLDNELKELADYLDIINSNLRETNFQVYPHLMEEIGFAETTSNLVEEERLRVPFQLQLRIENKTAWDSLDTDSHHHLFRITQELIANAKKHSEASIVKLHFYKLDHRFVLEYEDDGIGFDHQARSEGAGLLGISHRVSSLVGEMHMDTSFHGGVRMRIAWPYEGGLASEAAG